MKIPVVSRIISRFDHQVFEKENLLPLITLKKRTSVIFVLYLATVTLGLTAISAWMRSDFLLSTVLGLASVASLVLLIFEKKLDSLNFIKRYISTLIVILFLYLVSLGGLENTGLFWCYPLSIILFILYGAKNGLIFNAILVIASIVIFFFNVSEFNLADYSFAEKTRFLFSYTLLVLFVFIITYIEEVLVLKLDNARNILIKVARTDELTGLGNRRFINEALSNIDRRGKTQNNLTVLMLLDIDYFKKVNDEYGHTAGDFVIKTVAKRIQGCVRKTDLAARWGGEEFLVILTSTESKGAREIASKLRLAVANTPITYETNQIETTVSIGVSSFDELDADIEVVLKRADKNLYQAKSRGRNQIVF